MRRARARAIAAAAAAGSVLTTAAAAWACTVPISVLGVTPPVASPKSSVTVHGEKLNSWRSGPSPVELRWGGADGDLVSVVMADAEGNFSAQIPLPSASPGIYSMVAVAGGRTVGRAAVEMTAPAAPAATANIPLPHLSGHGEPGATSVDQRSDSNQRADGRDGYLAAGAGLAGVGLVGLAVGGLAAVSRRRRLARARR